MQPKSSGGFTLTETLFSMAVFCYFSIVLFSGISALNKINSGDSTRKLLMNQARIVMEKVIWGAGLTGESSRDGIAEAASYQIAGNTFHYTLPDGDERLIVQSQDELTFHKRNRRTTIYDPNGADNPPEPQKYSTQLTFTETSPGVLRVQLVLGERKNGVWEYASLSSAVALRN